VRILLDTNVLVAAFVAHGACNDLFEHCFREHTMITSEHLLREFRRVLGEKLGFPRDDLRDSIGFLRSALEIVTPVKMEGPICRDPDDDHVLAAALGGRAACIVTGDRDLLDLEEHQGIPILNPDGFWRFEDLG
jgi:putative PIN family toxin of toxin-antitoxin system